MVVSGNESRPSYMDSPFWSQSLVPAFSISANDDVIGINPAMLGILRIPGSFSAGRSLDRWLGTDLAQQIRVWVQHFLAGHPVPFPIQSSVFTQPVVLTEAVIIGQETIIKGLPVLESQSSEPAPDASRDAFLLSLGKSLSHDLRAPLRHLNIMTQRLLKPEIDLPEFLRTELQLITTCASDAYARATTLSEILKEEAQSLQTEEVDLNVLLQIISGTFTLHLESREGELRHEPMPMVLADKVSLQAILQELLSNAINHVPVERKPLITVSQVQTPEYTDILFTDNGIGIPSQHQEFLFKFMTQIHNELQGISPGLVLGLVRCKRKAQRMSMDLLTGEQPDQGATFRLRIPSDLIVA